MRNRLRLGGAVAVAALGIALFAAVPGNAMQTKQTQTVMPVMTVELVIDVAPVWAAHPVGFALLTHKGHQFAVFYDDKRQMTVAARKLTDKTWTFQKLPRTTGWDSHNYIALAVDDADCLHLSGDMHVNPLFYFRSAKPLDITSLAPVPSMVGTKEDKVTYPIFMRGANNAFLYTYRDGSSGNGDQIFNLYDTKARTWKRLLDKPLSDGEGERNAYFNLPELGPDGYYHLVWVWRESPDASSNHDPSYARSRDLVHWEKSDGTPLPLPITLRSGDIVYPIPVKGGVINNNVKLGFDKEKRPIVSYHKYDAAGNIQIYNARREAGGWKTVQASDWNWRWDFGGGGSIPFEVRVSPVRLRADGLLEQPYSTTGHGSGTWVLDPVTLKPVTGAVADSAAEKAPAYPGDFTRVTSPFPEMLLQTAGDSGASGEPGVRYVLRWETLGPNRDKARPAPLPDPVMLRVYKLRTGK